MQSNRVTQKATCWLIPSAMNKKSTFISCNGAVIIHISLLHLCARAGVQLMARNKTWITRAWSLCSYYMYFEWHAAVMVWRCTTRAMCRIVSEMLQQHNYYKLPFWAKTVARGQLCVERHFFLDYYVLKGIFLTITEINDHIPNLRVLHCQLRKLKN